MNIMIITERPDEVSSKLGYLMSDKVHGKIFIILGFEGKAEASWQEFFSLDYQGDNLILVADNIQHLWQGMRHLLDVVIETKNIEAEGWLVRLLGVDRFIV